jgi:hypothetical protein
MHWLLGQQYDTTSLQVVEAPANQSRGVRERLLAVQMISGYCAFPLSGGQVIPERPTFAQVLSKVEKSWCLYNEA